jgi:carboxypeptidase Q
MGQDPIEYNSHTWHTNLDTYERILEDDVKKDAMVVAWAVYQLANSDTMLPRLAKTDMPPKPPDEESTGAQSKPRPKTTRPRRNSSRRRGR